MTQGALEVKVRRDTRRKGEFSVEIRENFDGVVVQSVSKHSTMEGAKAEIAERLQSNSERRRGLSGNTESIQGDEV